MSHILHLDSSPQGSRSTSRALTNFGFIGITDITFLHAENLNAGKDSRQKAVDIVRHAMQQMVASW